MYEECYNICKCVLTDLEAEVSMTFEKAVKQGSRRMNYRKTSRRGGLFSGEQDIYAGVSTENQARCSGYGVDTLRNPPASRPRGRPSSNRKLSVAEVVVRRIVRRRINMEARERGRDSGRYLWEGNVGRGAASGGVFNEFNKRDENVDTLFDVNIMHYGDEILHKNCKYNILVITFVYEHWQKVICHEFSGL